MLGTSENITPLAGYVRGVAKFGNTDTGVRPNGTRFKMSTGMLTGKPPPNTVPGKGEPGGTKLGVVSGRLGWAHSPLAKYIPAIIAALENVCIRFQNFKIIQMINVS